MDERKHDFEEGENNEKTPSPEIDGVCFREESETEQVLRILLGVETGR